MKKTIYPCLWFNGKAGEAAEFYSSVFKDTSVTSNNPMVAMISSSGQQLMLLNGGPEYTFNSAISFSVLCESEEEIDNAWGKLLEGGSVLMPLEKYAWNPKYGWIKDRFGVSWQLYLGKIEAEGQKIAPSFLFTGNQHGKAEQAIQYYTLLFNDSQVEGILKFAKGEHDTEGTLKHGQFRLGKQVFMAMDSSLAPQISFNEAISFVVECESQEEIDYFWNHFTEEGEEGQCGWLKDKFGVSWQIIPDILGQLMSDPAKSQRVINAFLQMNKFDIEKLQQA